jgi:hypothetical protein
MQHLDFIIWMTIFPLAISISSYIDAKKNNLLESPLKFSKDIEGYTGMFLVAIWFIVGWCLF